MSSTLGKPEAFPEAFIWDISAFLAANLDPGNTGPLGDVVRRTLRDTDSNRSVGVISPYMQPQEDGGNGYQIGQLEPHLYQHKVEVWSMAKNYDESAGAQEHSILARNIRRMMAGDRDLRAVLAQNKDAYANRTERFTRLTFDRQRLFANEIDSQFIFLAVTELTIETETI